RRRYRATPAGRPDYPLSSVFIASTGFRGESSRRSWAGNRLAAGPVQGGIRTRPDGVRDDEDTALEPGSGGDGRRGPPGGPAGPGLRGTGGAGRHRPAGPDL